MKPTYVGNLITRCGIRTMSYNGMNATQYRLNSMALCCLQLFAINESKMKRNKMRADEMKWNEMNVHCTVQTQHRHTILSDMGLGTDCIESCVLCQGKQHPIKSKLVWGQNIYHLTLNSIGLCTWALICSVNRIYNTHQFVRIVASLSICADSFTCRSRMQIFVAYDSSIPTPSSVHVALNTVCFSIKISLRIKYCNHNNNKYTNTK